VARNIGEFIQSFLEKQIDSHIPILFFDVSYFKTRGGIYYILKALLVVAGVREDRCREILGTRVTDVEYELT